MEDNGRLTLTGRLGIMAAHIPEENDFPEDAAFMYGGDTMYANLVAMGQAIIDQYHELTHLQDYTIAFLWQKAASTSGGRKKKAEIRKTSGLLKYYAAYDFVVTVAADACRAAHLNELQLEALLYSMLLRIQEDDESGKVMLITPDIEMFTDELERYGVWNNSIEKARRGFEQLALNVPTPPATDTAE